MVLKLPTLIQNTSTKTGNDILIYSNLGLGKIIGTLAKTADGVVKVGNGNCGPTRANPDGGFAALVVNAENLGTINGGPPAGLPAKSPLFTALELDGTYSEDIDDYTATFATNGDSVQVVTFPDPDEDELICYDNGFSPAIGAIQRAIPRKYTSADHYVRQRFDGTLQLGELFVNNWSGIQRLRNIRCTIIAKVSAGQTGIYSEIYYFGNVMINANPLGTQADGNASIELQGNGNFSYMSIFSPVNPS